MREIKWLELGKYLIGVILAMLLIIVPALLLEPLEQSLALETRGETIKSMTGGNTVPEPVRSGNSESGSDYYAMSNGDALVFLQTRLANRPVNLAVRLDRNGTLRDCRILTLLMPPATWQIQEFAELAKTNVLKLPAPDPSQLEANGLLLSPAGNRDFKAFISTLNRAVEISRKAGKQ